MSSFSHCPGCRQQVAIPDGADPAAQVRCPHCHAEFSLSDTLADRADGPPDVILVTPPPAETPPAASPSAEAMSPETARLEQEVLELAEEASGLQSRAEGLQVTVHTSDPEPEAAAAQAEALENEAEALAAKVEAIADPVETLDGPTARPVTVARTYRAMGGALIATADALDTVAEVIQHKGIASQPEAPHEHPIDSEDTPVSELESNLEDALEIGEHHDEKPQDDETISLELPEPILEDEAPLPMSDAEPFFAATEPTATEPTATEPAATEPAATEPATTLGGPDSSLGGPDSSSIGVPKAQEAAGILQTPLAASPPGQTSCPGHPTEPAAAAESPVVEADSLLLRAVNLRSKAEALRTRGQDLLAKADALRVAAGAAGAEFEADEGGQEGEYAFHGDWASAGLGQAAGGSAGQSAGVATAAGGTAMPFPTIPRKQKKRKNPVREMVSIALGGLTGLALTYLVLNLVSAQYDYFGICPKWFPHIMKSETATQPASARSSKVSKDAKPGQPKAAKSPATHGSGTYVAHAGPEKQPAGKAAPLASLPELKPGPLDSPSGDTIPTTLPSEDTLPIAMISPSKSTKPEPQPPSADAAKFGKVADMLDPPAYGSADLGWALKSAQDAFQGDLKPENYPQLCRLAEVLTFVDPQKGVTGLPEQKAAVEKLLRDVGERDKHKNVKVIAQLADKWLDNPERDNKGVLLAGRVQTIVKKSQGTTIAVIALAKPDKNAPTERTIKMVSREPLDLQEKDAVIILGGLAVGGQGDHKELVVWHGMTVKFAVPPPKPK